MEFTTQSEYPVKAEFDDDGTIILSTQYEAYDAIDGKLEKVPMCDCVTLTLDELRQIYNAFKAFMGDN